MTTIVIPMAGLSSRFYKQGYTLPKYMLPVGNDTVFYHSLKSFSHFVDSYYLIIGIKGKLDVDFVNQQMELLGLNHYEIVLLGSNTNGQAETVYEGIKLSRNKNIDDILIFNIDTFRNKITYPKDFPHNTCDGYLETFIGSGSNWSNVMPDSTSSFLVKYTAEKQSISKYCCTGLYYFKNSKNFNLAYDHWINTHDATTEVYIAPLYNYLINEGLQICFTVIDKKDVIFCGVPDEYEVTKNGVRW